MFRIAAPSASLFALSATTMLAFAGLTGCDSPSNPGSGGSTSSSTSTAGSGSTSSSSSTSSSGSGVLDSGLYALADTATGVAFVKVDPTTGASTVVSAIPSLTPTDIEFADSAVDPVTHRYGALVSLQHATPDLAVIDGGTFSKVTAADVFGLRPKSGTGKFFTLQVFGQTPGLGLLDATSGGFTKIGDMAPANFLDAAASNGSDRYYLIAGADGASPGQWLFTWNTTNGQRTQVDLPQDRKYIAAEVDTALDRLFVLTFDAGTTPLIHLVDMSPTTGAMTEVLTLPLTPASTAPESTIALDDVTYDSKTHRFMVVAKGSFDPGPIPDQLFVIDTQSGQVVSSPMLAGNGGSIHGLEVVP